MVAQVAGIVPLEPAVLTLTAAMMGVPGVFYEELKEKTAAQQEVKMEAYSALTTKGLPVPAVCAPMPTGPYENLVVEYTTTDMDSVDFLLRADKLPLTGE